MSEERRLLVMIEWRLAEAMRFQGCRDEALGWQHVEAARELVLRLLSSSETGHDG